MNKFSLYILLILVFLGLSKSFSPSVVKTYQLRDINVFADELHAENFSILLLESFQTGFMIKTYFLKLKIVHAFKPPQFYTVRTTQELYQYYRPFLGMSVYRVLDKGEKPNSTPMPPGTLFVGNPAYGWWNLHNSGEKFWKFHRAYQRFPQIYYWGEFRPSYQFFKNTITSIKNNIPYFGTNQQFGNMGKITGKNLKVALKIEKQQKDTTKIKFKKYLKKYINLPPWKR